jgi:nicastrin
LASLLWNSVSVFAGSSSSNSLDEPFQTSFKNLPHTPCVTLYHRNGRVGCGTLDRENQQAPLFYYDGSTKLNQGTDFVAVIEEFALTKDIISGLLSSNSYGNLKGILVLNSTDSNEDDDYSSPGNMYPLGYGTPSAGLSYGNIQFPWNGNGDGLTAYDLFGIPMAYVNEWEMSESIRNVAQDANKAAKIMAEFNYYMGPDGVNSAECLAWKDDADKNWSPKCLPLGGTSVWGHAGSPPVSASDNASDNANDNANDNGERKLEDSGSGRPAVVIGAAIDATSMFHELATGANTAGSNILALLMAAYQLGQSVDDATLDALPNRILFGFFQGESYGYLGSRSFFRDIFSFTCKVGPVASVSDDEDSQKACLFPLRPDLSFRDIGTIAGMLTVDQVGVPLTDGVLYVHNDGSGGMGTFMANVLKSSSTSVFSVAASAAGEDSEGDEYPYPPTPLQSLMSLTEGATGGAVLSGYDYVFAKRPPYQSHLNSINNIAMDLKSIASSATLLARTALAAAYDDGSYDYATAATYATNAIPELEYDDELLVELANCLYVDGNCKMLKKYAEMEATNEKARTGLSMGSGSPLGTPPNYYVSVYNMFYGQPFAQVGDNVYGSYNGQDYGNKKSDAVAMQPRLLEQAIRNMLHDFLGRGANVDSDGNSISPRSCKKAPDCSGVSYCAAEGDSATCSGRKVCVCTRGHYHTALDEALVPAANNYTGYFTVNDKYGGNSPIYTEPFWLNDVGVKLYRDSKTNPGFISLAIGLVTLLGCFFVTVILKVSMKKEKVY